MDDSSGEEEEEDGEFSSGNDDDEFSDDTGSFGDESSEEVSEYVNSDSSGWFSGDWEGSSDDTESDDW